MLGVISLKERTGDVNIFNAFKIFLTNLKKRFLKLILIIEGTTAMIGRINEVYNSLSK